MVRASEEPSLNVLRCTWQVSVTLMHECFDSNASQPKMLFPVALFPEPTFPTRTRVTSSKHRQRGNDSPL
jgi:hypothetical protein